VRQFLNGDIEGARNTHFKLMPLFKALFIETNPIPVKACMGIMKMLKPAWRLPLCEPMPETMMKLKKVLKNQGLI